MSTQPEKFSLLAKQYCSWAEESSLAQEDDVKKAIFLLVALYSNALVLSKDGCGDEIEAKEVTNEEWKVIYTRFGSLPFNYYSAPFSPAKLDEEQEIGDVADDLADIYRDIKNGLWLFENGNIIEAVWEWKQNFNTHWGRHAVSALNALHCYMADEYVEF